MALPCPLCTRLADPDDPLLIHRTPLVSLSHMSGFDLPGYLVLSPVRHVENAGELDAAEQTEMARIQSFAVQIILGLPKVRKVYILSFGEALPHLHLHLFPRTEAMLSDPLCLSDGIADGPKIFDSWRRQLAVPDLSAEVLSLIANLQKIFRGSFPPNPG